MPVPSQLVSQAQSTNSKHPDSLSSQRVAAAVVPGGRSRQPAFAAAALLLLLSLLLCALLLSLSILSTVCSPVAAPIVGEAIVHEELQTSREGAGSSRRCAQRSLAGGTQACLATKSQQAGFTQQAAQNHLATSHAPPLPAGCPAPPHTADRLGRWGRPLPARTPVEWFGLHVYIAVTVSQTGAPCGAAFAHCPAAEAM